MKKVWPVIHIKNCEIALQNAQIAHDAGCHGIFLISMDNQDEKIDPIGLKIRERIPKLEIGVNYLSLLADEAVNRSLSNGWNATWVDDSGIHSTNVEEIALTCAELITNHQFFASIAFKYQRVDPKPPIAALHAQKLGMIPTTSGDATGSAPDVEKLKNISEVLNGTRLAVASGITPDNVTELSPYVTDILVATGISLDFYRFDADKLKALMNNLTS